MSHSQFHEKSMNPARPINRAHNKITVPQATQQKFDDGACVDSGTAYMKPSLQEQMVLQCQTAFSGLINSSGSCDFILRRNSIHISQAATLRYSVRNDDSSNVVLPPAPLMIERVEVLSNGGSHQLQQLYGSDLMWNANLKDTPEHLTLQSNVMNTTATLGGGSAIAPAATASYIVPLKGSIFERELYMPCINDLTVRVHWNGYAEAGTLNIAITNLDCVIQAREVSKMEQNDLKEKWQRKHQLRFYQTVQHNISATLAASTQYSYNLSGLQGLVNNFSLYVRTLALTSSTNGRTIRDYVSNFEIKDAGGSNVIGGNVETSANNRYINQAKWLPSTLANSHALHFWSFAESPVQDWKVGSNTGFYPFEGSETLTLTTNSSATGSCQINFDCSVAHLISFDGTGNAMVQK